MKATPFSLALGYFLVVVASQPVATDLATITEAPTAEDLLARQYSNNFLGSTLVDVKEWERITRRTGYTFSSSSSYGGCVPTSRYLMTTCKSGSIVENRDRRSTCTTLCRTDTIYRHFYDDEKMLYIGCFESSTTRRLYRATTVPSTGSRTNQQSTNITAGSPSPQPTTNDTSESDNNSSSTSTSSTSSSITPIDSELTKTTDVEDEMESSPSGPEETLPPQGRPDAGLIAGSVIGGVGAIAIITLLVYIVVLLRKKNEARQNRNTEPVDVDDSHTPPTPQSPFEKSAEVISSIRSSFRRSKAVSSAELPADQVSPASPVELPSAGATR